MFSMLGFWTCLFSAFFLFWHYHSARIHFTVCIFVEHKCTALFAKFDHSNGSCFKVIFFFFLSDILASIQSSFGIWCLFHSRLQWRAKILFDCLTKPLASHLEFRCRIYSLLSSYFCHTLSKSGLEKFGKPIFIRSKRFFWVTI